MIVGARYWNDRARYYSQENNSIEALLKRTGRKWLESCGPTACVTCLDVLGYDIAIRAQGVYAPQAEDVVTLAMNDPRFASTLAAIRGGVEALPGNRVPQYYPWAAKVVFNALALFVLPLSWTRLVDEIRSGAAVQICRIDPGHYVAAVAYDSETREIIYHDPWPSGQPDGDGFSKKLTEDEYRGRFHPWGVVYERRSV